MDTIEKIHNALEWANKRLELQGEPITENQRNYIVFALRQRLTMPDAIDRSEQLSKRPNTSSTLEFFTKSEKKPMKRSFIKDCLFFQSKELLHKFLGVFVWLNILQICLVIINLWSKYCH